MPGELEDVLGRADRNAIAAELKDLESRADELDRQISLRREFLTMLDRWEGRNPVQPDEQVEGEGSSSVPSPVVATVPEVVNAPTRPMPKTSPAQRREAILDVLRRRPDRELSTEAIRAALDAAGVDFESGTPLKGHLFRMVEKGLIERPRLGHYKLPAPEEGMAA